MVFLSPQAMVTIFKMKCHLLDSACLTHVHTYDSPRAIHCGYPGSLCCSCPFPCPMAFLEGPLLGFLL